MDQDDLVAVAEDLQYLSEWGADISNAEIRRGSAVLRRLLVEDAYGAAWRAIGRPKQPKLIAVDLDELLGEAPLHKVTMALAAGANIGGMQVAGMVVYDGVYAPQASPAPTPRRPEGYPGEREYTLSEFLASRSGVVAGKDFSRRDVVKYIANIKGGVHLSAKQRKAEQKLVARLGKIEKRLMVHKTDGLLVEIVAIAQALGASSDAQGFVDSVLV